MRGHASQPTPGAGPPAACQKAQIPWALWGTSKAGSGEEASHGKVGQEEKDAPDREHDNERMIAQNRRARHEYEVMDTLECGIVLVGSEVKSLRAGTLSLDEAYGRVKQGEVWLVGCDIAEYVQSHQFNHEPRRPRKLLMHRREIKKFANLAFEKGLTLVPLKMYFKEGRAKVLWGFAAAASCTKARKTETEHHETRHRPGHAPRLRPWPVPPSGWRMRGRPPRVGATAPCPLRPAPLGEPLDEDANDGMIIRCA